MYIGIFPHFKPRLILVVFLQNVETSVYRDVSTLRPRFILVVFLQNVETSVYTHCLDNMFLNILMYPHCHH